MSKFQLTDAQRRAAIDKANVNTALTSGAGCGKTAVLARRFVQLLLAKPDADDPLARLVALTFTDKAAMEMRQRLAKLLADLLDDGGDVDRSTVRGWIERLGEARIMTIHSFCSALLRTHAIAAGVDPNFSVLADELVTRQMVSDAAQQATLAAVESGNEPAALLVAEFGFEQTVSEVAGLVSGRLGVDLAALADPQATLARWRQQAADQATAAWLSLERDPALLAELRGLAEEPCADAADKLGVWRDEKLAIARSIITDPAARTAENFDAIAKKSGGIGIAANWGGKDVVKSLRHRLKALLEAMGQWAIYTQQLNDLDGQAADSLACLTGLATRAQELFAAAKRSRGLLDFTDLLSQAADLLAGNPQLRAGISSQIDQLLIDECQDTNAFQLEMLMGLARDGADAPPPGKLCLIGDAKQSIYRFRGAQVEVFRGLCEEIAPDGRENLDISFRTHAAGIAFINELFSPLMGDGYEPVQAHRTQTPAQPAVEIILAAPGDDQSITSTAQAGELQAAATAQRIAELVDSRQECVWDAGAQQFRPAEYSDIAILFARMTRSLDYERQLAARGVPYYVVAGAGFFRQQEVYDVLNALRVIDNPLDDTPLMGLFRSNMFALDDNALMHIAETLAQPYAANFQPKLLADRLTPDDLAAMSAAVAMVTRLHRQKDSLGIDALIEAVLAATGYEATLMAQPNGRRKVGNVRLLLDRGRSAWREGMTLANFIMQMNSLTLSESRYEQAAVAGEGDNVVRLMTIHKAKGLEFPVVFVPDLNAGSGGAGNYSRVLHRADWGLTCRVSSEEGYDDGDDEMPLSHRLARAREKADAQDEAIRQYYVALTRHEDMLVLVGADWRDKAGQLRQAASFIRRADEAISFSQSIDAGNGHGEMPYGDGYVAVCRRLTPAPPGRQSSRPPPGRAMLAKANDPAALLAAIADAADPVAPAPPLLSPLPSSLGEVELAVTALSDFATCPMLYRWRYDLRVPPATLASCPRDDKPTGDDPPEARADGASVDAATAGTFFHRCVELLNFAAPQPVADLARQVGDEMAMLPADVGRLADELADMLSRFKADELWGQIAGTDLAFRELDFLLPVGPIRLRGKIDLLLTDEAGEWRVVDYKSDRLAESSARGVAEHSGHHRLQMLIYSLAAQHAERQAPSATLYYLRSAVSHTFTFDAPAIAAGRQEIVELGRSLIASRRSGGFRMCRSASCDFCPYGLLCDRFGEA